jgi:hypothetical protein
MTISVPTLHQQLTDLWEAEWSGEGLSESAVAQKFLDYVDGFEFELREQIARAIEEELDGDNSVWDRAIMVSISVAKGK